MDIRDPWEASLFLKRNGEVGIGVLGREVKGKMKLGYKINKIKQKEVEIRSLVLDHHHCGCVQTVMISKTRTFQTQCQCKQPLMEVGLGSYQHSNLISQ